MTTAVARTKDDHYMVCVPETTMIAILEGVRDQIKRYERDKAEDWEDREFIRDMLLELREFETEAAGWIKITDNGWIRTSEKYNS